MDKEIVNVSLRLEVADYEKLLQIKEYYEDRAGVALSNNQVLRIIITEWSNES